MFLLLFSYSCIFLSEVAETWVLLPCLHLFLSSTCSSFFLLGWHFLYCIRIYISLEFHCFIIWLFMLSRYDILFTQWKVRDMLFKPFFFFHLLPLPERLVPGRTSKITGDFRSRCHCFVYLLVAGEVLGGREENGGCTLNPFMFAFGAYPPHPPSPFPCLYAGTFSGNNCSILPACQSSPSTSSY